MTSPMSDQAPPDPDLLARLAEGYGIEPHYYDIWGALHRVGPEATQALLHAMGLSVASTAEVGAELRAHDEGRWRRPLPAALVLQEAGASPLRLKLSLPRVVERGRLRWRLCLEDGQRYEALVRPRELAVVGERAIDGEAYACYAIELPVNLPLGYHQLVLQQWRGRHCRESETTLIVVPPKCYQPQAIADGRRVWGLSLQLYGLRSEPQWGIGDFGDLRRAVELGHALGAALVGLNPLHALFAHNPLHRSPYAPSSRLFLNALYVDVAAVPELDECEEARRSVQSPEFQRRLEQARQAEFVDYRLVAAIKRPVLEQLFQHFRTAHEQPATQRGLDFAAFVAAGGEALRLHAVYEALQESLWHELGMIGGWPWWPERFRDPASPAVAAFAAAHAERVLFFQYLQWLADQQLAAVGTRCFQLGMGVGLYADLAVSTDRGGAETWAAQQVYAMSASVGAPPDDFSPTGQDWGLPPMIPHLLAERAYRPFIAVLRQNMRHAGALRIDHVMGLMRLFWVPPGGSAADGAYVRYPFEELLGIVALESHRNHCLLIGEDLGTVPDEVREAMQRFGLLSYRPMLFQRGAMGEFLPPQAYPQAALVAVSTHDLPTLQGYWRGRDVEVRAALGHYGSDDQVRQQHDARAGDRWQLLTALQRQGLLPAGVGTNAAALPELSGPVVAAIHRYLARCPSQVMVVQCEDLLGVGEQANLPGTTDEHANWQRRLPLPLEQLRAQPMVAEVVQVLAQEQRSSGA
ncbi:MAG: 4-alpha-glucanotransferase [Proteobacteria bacterium]|nr:4-alpha-glucanotransferase [Pseudomonadota bacterium]